MTTSQKVIKYLAIAIAVALIISAALGIFAAVSHIVKKTEDKDKNPGTTVSQQTDKPETNPGKPADNKESQPGKQEKPAVPPQGDDVFIPDKDIKILEINAGAAEVNIIEGGSFYVSTDNRNISCGIAGEKLTVNTKHRNEDDKRAVTVSVPSDKIFDKIIINAGAESFNADLLKAEVLEMHIAAGDMNIGDVEISSRAQIDFAAGFLKIDSGSINDLKINMAVGAIDIEADLTGRTQLTCGGGAIDLNLPRTEENYSVELSSILCTASLNGRKIERGSTVGSGENKIDITGAAGSVTVKTR